MQIRSIDSTGLTKSEIMCESFITTFTSVAGISRSITDFNYWMMILELR